MIYPKVTIVILNFNGLKDTKKCLKSLLATTYSHFKVIIVDNGSDQDEAALLKKKFKDRRIQFIRLVKNLGFTGGNNKILSTLKEKYVVLLNNDVEVTYNWLTPLVEIMERNKSIGVIQPKILWSQNKKYFDYAGASGGFIDIFGYPFTRGRIFNTQEKDRGQYDNICDIFWASGAAMMVRKSVLNKVGLFDERFFNYMEEIDLCYRIHQAGYKIICLPKSYVYHKVAATASRRIFNKRFWEHRNNLILIFKNYPYMKILFILPLRMILEFISIFYYFYTKRLDYALAVIKAQISFIFIMPQVLFQRLHTKQTIRKKMEKLIYPGSLVFSYFILKRKKFSQILQ